MNLLQTLKLPHQLIQVQTKNSILQISTELGSKRFKGGSDGGVELFDPYAGTGVRQLYKQLNEWLGPQIGQGVEAYPGQMVAGPTALQSQAFGTAAGLDPLAQGGMNAFSQALNSYNPNTANQYLNMPMESMQNMMGAYDPTAAQSNWEANMAPAFDMWKDDVVPGIQEMYAGMNAADSGAMNKALAESGEDLALSQNALLSNSLYTGEQDWLNRQLSAAGMAGGLSQIPGQNLSTMGNVAGMSTDLLSQMLNIGSTERGIEGEQLMEPYNKWMYSQPYNNPYLQNFLGTALSQPPMSSYTQAPTEGAMSSLMPALGSFMGSKAGSTMTSAALTALMAGI